jgi:dihydrofolate synthase/folylpolyglutamate synthase
VPERAIAVVGTNGKTSTATYVERLLRGAGLSTGLTVSPHLRSWGERVVVNGEPVSEEILAAAVESLSQLAAERDDLRVFDLVTLAAAGTFERHQVDVAIFEAGIGGRLDAAAVLRPAVVALTSISLDHVELLGDDAASILREKLGVAPPGATVVSARLGDELESVARELCPTIELVDALAAGILERNAALAEVVARRAVERFGLDARVGRLDGFAVAGRLQREVVDGVDVVIDAAHNPGAWDAVRSELPPSFVAVVSAALDRPVDALIPALAGATVVVATTAWHGHTTEAAALAEVLAGLPVQVVDAPAEATRLAFTRAKEAGVPLVALGSTYLVPHVLDELGL